jgi:hypothetical protein
MECSTTLNSKLKNLCPTLYSTLSLWENDALDSSRWLYLSTTIVKGHTEGDKDTIDPVLAGSARPTTIDSSPVLVSGVLPSLSSESSAHSPTKIQQNILPQLFNTRAWAPNFSPSSPELLDTLVEPRFREFEVDESTLSVVLDSLIPFIRDTNTTIKLPTYMGKVIHDPTSDSGEINSLTYTEGNGKEFAWSRGLDIEHSPIKTRSTQKQLAVLSS